MKRIFFLIIIVSLVLVSCQNATPTTPTIDPDSLVETMMATIQGQPTPTVPEETPVPTAGPDPGHLAKLLEGRDSWNTWRTQFPEIRPDLRNANLAESNLSRYNLAKTNFLGANLQKAKMLAAILTRANFVNANLNSADLWRAKLNNAILRKAKLIDANLVGANLTNADLTDAVLTNARYDNTTVWPIGFDPVAAGAILVVP